LAGDGQAANLPVLNATEDPDLLAFGEVGQTAVSMPNIPEMGAVWGSWNDAVALTITGGNTPENAFTTAAGQIRDLIAGVNVTEGLEIANDSLFQKRVMWPGQSHWERRTRGVIRTDSEVLVRHGSRTTQSHPRPKTSMI